MVHKNVRHPRRRWKLASATLVLLLVSLSLASCSSPGDPMSTATTVPTTSTLVPTVDSTSTSTLPRVATGAPSPTPSPTDPPTATEPPPLNPEEFAAEVTGLVDSLDGLVEVVVTRPDGTTLADINSYEPMEAASLYKLGIMVEIYVEREMGELALDEELILEPEYFTPEDSAFTDDDIGISVSIETLLQSMITLSSNVAASALLARVGNENVNLTMASLGLSSTEIRWSPGVDPYVPDDDATVPEDDSTEDPESEPTVEDVSESDNDGALSARRELLGLPGRGSLDDARADAALNVTTAADIASLYVMLVNGQIISEEASQEMLTLLEDQQINDRLPAYLPEGTIVAHKTGNLDGLVHDAGVIFTPSGPVVVVIMTEDVEEWQAIDLIATVARLAYDSVP
ncbi:MAG TPA: serine hydrolase [Thermomicrobiales bacterium]|nr:serine hydrolase [Thermomicrobiales bacterium]